MDAPGDDDRTDEATDAPEGGVDGIPDEHLPDDLVPGDENPLAEGLDDGETVDGLMDGGREADRSGVAAEQHEDSDDDSDESAG